MHVQREAVTLLFLAWDHVCNRRCQLSFWSMEVQDHVHMALCVILMGIKLTSILDGFSDQSL